MNPKLKIGTLILLISRKGLINIGKIRNISILPYNLPFNLMFLDLFNDIGPNVLKISNICATLVLDNSNHYWKKGIIIPLKYENFWKKRFGIS